MNAVNSSQCSPATPSPGGVCYNFAGANATAPKIRAVTTDVLALTGSNTVKFNILPLFASSFSGNIQVKDDSVDTTYWVYPVFNVSTTSFYSG